MILSKYIKKILLLSVLVGSSSLGIVFAKESESANFKLIGASIGTAGKESASASQKISVSVGNPASDDRTSSTLYMAKQGNPNVWVANVPKISCFETVSSGTTNCTDADIVPNGMVMLCGEGGCYDRARFEIDIQNNTPEVLYSIRISTDPLWNSWQYLDGATFLLEDEGTHDIDDYLLKSDWEGTTNSFNVLGLKPDTTYYIRATALKGDFTETPLGPLGVSANTSVPQISFDIDIADIGGVAIDTNAPHGLDLGVLVPMQEITAENLIWIDLGTNAYDGVEVYIQDSYAGLSSFSAVNVIASASLDLSVVNEGFGLQVSSVGENALGPLDVVAPFDGGGENIGGVSLTAVKIFDSSSAPISGGRGGIYVKAKADTSTLAGSDYLDELTFSVLGSF